MKRSKPADSGLIFDWGARDGGGGRLFIGALIAAAAFAGLFVGFRILTPETRPVNTRPQQVLVLNPNIPAELALIHQAMDRSFALIPTDGLGASIPADAALPVYRPDSAEYEMKLLPLTSSTLESRKPRLLTQDLDIALPAAPPPVVQPAAAPAPTVLHAVLEGEAAPRLQASPQLEGIALADPNRPQFRLAVNEQGRVVMALPLMASKETTVMQQLHDALMTLRFAPAAKPVEWAQVTFRWGAVR